MRHFINQYLPMTIITVLMMSIMTFIGGVFGFILTEDTMFLAVTITGIHAVFFSVVFGISALFLLDA